MTACDGIIGCIGKLKGIRAIFVLDAADKFHLLDIEVEAEKKAFMGMGKTYNSGIRDVLRCPLVVVAITDMDFEWGCQSHMILKKDESIVGEEVRDSEKIAHLQTQPNVFFLHKNFVIYRDRVDFPRDIVEKRCCFELPALAADECFVGLDEFGEYVFCFPSTPGDVFLKRRFIDSVDEWGTGSVLIGFKDCQ
jgi:hypothetical protein